MALKQAIYNIKGLNRDDSQIVQNNEFALENLNIRIDSSSENSLLTKVNDGGNSLVQSNSGGEILGMIIGCHNVDGELIIFTTDNSVWHQTNLLFKINQFKFHDIFSNGFSASIDATDIYGHLDWNNIVIGVKASIISKTNDGYSIAIENESFTGGRVYDSNVPNKYLFNLATDVSNIHAVVIQRITLYYNYYNPSSDTFSLKQIYVNKSIYTCLTQQSISGYSLFGNTEEFPTYENTSRTIYHNTTEAVISIEQTPVVNIVGGIATPDNDWFTIAPDDYHNQYYKCFALLKNNDDDYDVAQELPSFPTSEVSPNVKYLILYHYDIISKKDIVVSNIQIATTATQVQGNVYAITANPVPSTQYADLKIVLTDDFAVKNAYKIGGITTWIIEALTDSNFSVDISYEDVSASQAITIEAPTLTASLNGSTQVFETITITEDAQDLTLDVTPNTSYEIIIDLLNAETQWLTPNIDCTGIIHYNDNTITISATALSALENARVASIKVVSKNNLLPFTYYYNIIQTK